MLEGPLARGGALTDGITADTARKAETKAAAPSTSRASGGPPGVLSWPTVMVKITKFVPISRLAF